MKLASISNAQQYERTDGRKDQLACKGIAPLIK